jgi:aryl-alcohol dehydrogenase-like predicted oxidoreductase
MSPEKDFVSSQPETPIEDKGTSILRLSEAPLSGDFRNNSPRFTKEAVEANQALVDLLKEVAADKGAAPAQEAIA